MDYFDKEYCLEVWGDYACFTRPEFKVERVSYDVITPSAARAIFDAIFWKNAIRWEITKIEVINPIKWLSVRRNEVGAVASAKANASPIYINEKRQQRNTLMLRDVCYRIHARMVFIPISKRTVPFKHAPGDDENPGKYQAMFERRASKGQCFNQPYLGTRECAASFRLVQEGETDVRPPIKDSRDFGVMLFDMDFSDAKNITPLFYRPMMEEGIINVPPFNSKEILR